jgi:hypothetical protein
MEIINDDTVDSELDLNKRLALEVRSQIESSSEEERQVRLDTLYHKWVLIQPVRQNTNVFTFLEKAITNYGLRSTDLRIGSFERARKLAIFEITYLHLFFMQGKMSVEDADEDDDDIPQAETTELKNIKMKFNKIFSSMIDAENAIRSSIFLQTSMSEEEFKISEGDIGLFRFTPIDYSTNTAYQNLLLYLLEQLLRKGYRRYNDECYQPIFTEEGHDTHAWKKAMTLKDFIHEVCKKEINFNMWKNLTSSKDNVRAAVQYISEYIGGEFEDLLRDRHIFSFNNGIYIVKKSKIDKEGIEVFHDEWIPFVGPNSKTIGTSVVACKYFNEPFTDCTQLVKDNGWFSIIVTYCPHFKSIMDYQQWPEDVQKWLCILIGRNMYDLGELEEWQILGYLLGQAGSGKSYASGTRVLCYDGSFKEVQDLKKGDILMGDDSKPRNVLSCTAGVDQMYKVKQRNGEDYVVNGLHELCLKMTYCNKGMEFRNINGQKYRKGDIVEINVESYMKLSISQKKALKGYKTGVEFHEKDVPLDPYILGLWLGDGTSSRCEIVNRDAAILKYLANNLGKYDCYLKHNFNQRKYNHYKYDIKGIEKENRVWEIIKSLQLQNNKHIPDIYKINSRKNRLELLAGLLDSDGSLSTGCFDIIQKNKQLAEDIQYLVRSLGFYTKIVECKKSSQTNPDTPGTYYRMCISGNLDQIPTKVPRKQATPRKQVKNVLNTGIKIEKFEVDYFYGVQLDGNHRLVLGDFTVGHNSTILTKIIKRIYESCDVGVLSNNIEKKFGLSALADKFMFIGPEIKGNLSLEQSEFQSVISGEDVQIAEKHQKAKTIVWKSPGFCAGNEVPNYKDNSGSISRRVMVFKFDRKVKKGDTRLGKKLEKEIRFVIQACAKGYLEAIEKYGGADIWDCVPEYFKKTKEDMAENTNALTNFLKSDRVRVGPEYYCRSKLFVACFNDHCRENNLGTAKWCSDYYLGPFSNFNIVAKKNVRRRYPNVAGARTYHGLFILGVDLMTDIDQGCGGSDDEYEDPED